MENKYKISINIPTRNSDRTIESCLKSVKDQTYSNTEIILIDSYSTDDTIKIAESFDVKIIQTNDKLLGARYIGAKESDGDYILLLDSDQILEKTALDRAMDQMNNYDMLCLEENSYNPTTFIERLFEADRKLVHKLSEIHLDPINGVLLARLYKKELLLSAFEAIPKELSSTIVAHDHAIIYYEAFKLSSKVGILPLSVWHMEPSSLIDLWKKNYRYGKTTKDLVKSGYYTNLFKKVRFRKGALKSKYGLASFLLLCLKGIAYQIGYNLN